MIEGVAWADDPLVQARKAIAESDYAAARSELAAARDAGGHGPEDAAEIYRLSGIAEAALGDSQAATDAFTRFLALSPRAALSKGMSPKITRPFDAAAGFFTNHEPLEVRLETSSTPPTITLIVVSDPLGMVSKAGVVFTIDGGPEQTREVVASERTDITLPAGKRIDVRLAALDDHGNRLVELGSKVVPIVIISEPAPAPAIAVVAARPVARPVAVRAGARPIYLLWWPYAATAVAFAGGAGYFAWSAHTDASELEQLNGDSVHHPFGDARAVADRGRRDTLITNIGLGAAGAFAIAAGVLYFMTPRDRVEARITAVPVRGGAAVVWGGKL